VLVFEGGGEPEGVFAAGQKPEGPERRLADELHVLAPPGWLVKSYRSAEEAIAAQPKRLRSARTTKIV
jgi:hypothetical protein